MTINANNHTMRVGAGGVLSPVPNERIEQFYILDENWGILVYDILPDLVDEIDSLSGGTYIDDVNFWISEVNERRFPWSVSAAANATRNLYLPIARRNLEVPLNETTYFTIDSDDPNYSLSPSPAQTVAVNVSVDGYRYAPDSNLNPQFICDYRSHTYINFPSALVDGESYRVTIGNGENILFTYDEDVTVSRAIKVNQVGYLSDATEKYAYMGSSLYKFGPLDLSHATAFDVIDVATGLSEFSGTPTLVASNPNHTDGVSLYGEDVYEMDFSAMTSTGTFYIRVPGVGRSWEFQHGTSVYDQVFYTTVRNLYHQRAGMANVAPYTNWERPKAALGPEYFEADHMEWPEYNPKQPTGSDGVDNGYSIFGMIGGYIDYGTSTPEQPGGWHDAADWDCRQFHYGCVFDLLYAYQFAPSNFTDNQFNIPESGNGVPDILSEVRHGLELWRISQDPVTGGVSNRLETWTHADINSTISSGSGPTYGPREKTDYAFGKRTRWGSLTFAAAAAQYARLVAAHDPADAAIYQTAAVNAYNFGTDAANKVPAGYNFKYKQSRGQGAEIDSFWTRGEIDEDTDPSLMHAKLQLYLLTLDTAYLSTAPTISTLLARIDVQVWNEPYKWKWGVKDYSPWYFYSIIEAEAVLPTEAATWRAWFIADADAKIANLTGGSGAYKRTIRENYAIGFMGLGNMNLNNWSRAQWIAYVESGETAKYRDAAILNSDFMYGCNPMGMSWTTGIGSNYPAVIQDEWSTDDGIKDPVPGITLFGINGAGVYATFRNEVWTYPEVNNEDITSLTQTGGTATAITVNPHRLETGDKVVIFGANENEYEIDAAVTVIDPNTFQYTVDVAAPATATGTIKWYWWFVNDPNIGDWINGSASSANIALWRRWMCHPDKNVGQCEFTINETCSANTFTAAMLSTNTETIAEKTITSPPELNGFWYTV